MTRRKAALFDVDGTLTDTNYAHVLSWSLAFRAHGHVVPMADIHRSVGMGSDQLVPHLLGSDEPAVRHAHSSFYAPFLETVQVLPGAPELLRAAARLGLTVVLATSASPEEAQRLCAALDADGVVAAVTDKGDVERSKPAPDIVTTAMATVDVEPADCVFVGDTVWDVTAAGRVGVPCVGVTTGGIGPAELTQAGAVAVYRDARHLLAELAASPLGQLANR